MPKFAHEGNIPEGSPLHYIKRKGDSSDPYLSITETIIVQNGRAPLKEVPDRVNKVVVSDMDNAPWNEVKTKNEIKNPTDYSVDYRDGVVYFHESAHGKRLKFKFMGTGVFLIPMSRIWTEYEGGKPTDTLKTLVDETYEMLDKGNKKITETEKARQESIKTTNDANAKITDIENRTKASEKKMNDKITEVDTKTTAVIIKSDTFVNTKKAEYEKYVATKQAEYEKYKTDKNAEIDTKFNNKATEVDNKTNAKINEVNTTLTKKVGEFDAKVKEVDTKVNAKVLEATNKIAETEKVRVNAVTATNNANTATKNANDQATYAKQQGDYAKAQGDYAKGQGENAKTQADYAKGQGDYAKKQGENALGIQKEYLAKEGFNIVVSATEPKTDNLNTFWFHEG